MRLGAPQWFVREAGDHRPVLPPPGEPDALWWGPSGPIWLTGERLWLPVRDRVVRLAVYEVPRITTDGLRVIVQVADGAVAIADRQGLDVVAGGPGVRAGADLRCVRRALRWSCDLPLPEGAVRTPRLTPLPLGRGVVWADGGWVYRLEPGRRVAAVGLVAADEELVVGPRGAVLVGERAGDGLWFTRAIPPGRSQVPLEVPVRDEALRWSHDGERIAALVDDDELVTARIDLRAGAITDVEEGVLPVDDRRVHDPARGVIRLGREVVARGFCDDGGPARWA